MINPNNYDGVTATVVGRAAAAPENPPYDKEGTRGFQQIRVAVSQGYKDKNTNEWIDTGTLWITHTARSEDLYGIEKGTKVRIDEARLEAREFTRKDGTTGQAFETRFGQVSIVSQPSGPAQGASGGFATNAESPF